MLVVLCSLIPNIGWMLVAGGGGLARDGNAAPAKKGSVGGMQGWPFGAGSRGTQRNLCQNQHIHLRRWRVVHGVRRKYWLNLSGVL